MIYGLDLSNYTTNVPVPGAGARGGAITPSTVACWVETGYTHAIVGTQWPLVARHQLEVCAAGGMSLDAYAWLSWDRDVRAAVATALETIRGFEAGRLWLDCEEATDGRPPSEIVSQIEAAVDAAQSVPVGIYTARWWWPAATGDSAAFAHLPLWHAEYTYREGYKPSQDEAPRFDSFVPYGGWTRPAVWQYAGSVQHCGANVDLNVIAQDSIEGEPALDAIREAALQERNAKELLLWNLANRLRVKATPAYDAVHLLDLQGAPLEPPVLIPLQKPPWWEGAPWL
ncbi:MAG TPA: GH25 family lysozyme [Dehalococcoidia bacterium]|nr:GH25 family lysozyme [Dehalococcoidia bacterium]